MKTLPIKIMAILILVGGAFPVLASFPEGQVYPIAGTSVYRSAPFQNASIEFVNNFTTLPFKVDSYLDTSDNRSQQLVSYIFFDVSTPSFSGDTLDVDYSTTCSFGDGPAIAISQTLSPYNVQTPLVSGSYEEMLGGDGTVSANLSDSRYGYGIAMRYTNNKYGDCDTEIASVRLNDVEILHMITVPYTASGGSTGGGSEVVFPDPFIVQGVNDDLQNFSILLQIFLMIFLTIIFIFKPFTSHDRK